MCSEDSSTVTHSQSPQGLMESAGFSPLCRTRPGPCQSSWKRPCTHPISIKGSPEVVLSCFHGLHQVSGVGEVGVRVVTSEVLQRDTVNRWVGRGTQFFAEDLLHVWSHNYVKCEMKNQKLWFVKACQDQGRGWRHSKENGGKGNENIKPTFRGQRRGKSDWDGRLCQKE